MVEVLERQTRHVVPPTAVSEAERIKDEFISRVTHELRTPLCSIQGYVEMLGDPDLPPAVRADFLERVRRNSDRLVALMDEILLAAQVSAEAGNERSAANRRPADLAGIAAGAAERNRALIEGKGLTMSVEIGDTVLADVDEVRLGQAVDRLIRNAAGFTAAGGITVGAEVRDGRAVLTVRDTGIAGEDRDRMLTPFRRPTAAERAAAPGTGLGLGIVTAIVDNHGGVLSIDEEPDRWTTVSIELPVAAAVVAVRPTRG